MDHVRHALRLLAPTEQARSFLAIQEARLFREAG
jgi:hypothetical protein